MRHSVFLKFIAVFLCAVSLMTAAGSGLGLLVVWETGLRSRTPEEVYAEATESTANSLAQELALRAASRKLGGASDALIEQYYGSHWMQSTFDWSQVGYTVSDEAGNVLEQEALLGDAYKTYEFKASGSRYLKVHSTMTMDEYHAMINPSPEVTASTQEPDAGLTCYNAVPEEGCEFYSLSMTCWDGSTRGFDSEGEPLGRLEYFQGAADQIVVRLTRHNAAYDILAAMGDGLPRGMVFLSENQVVYEIHHPQYVVEEFSYNTGMPYILLRPADSNMQTQANVYDAIPEGGVQVSGISIAYADHYSESTAGSPDIGFLTKDEDGFVVFTSADFGILDIREEVITFISFKDTDGILVYSATDDAGVGRLSVSDDVLVFTNRDSAHTDVPDPTPEEVGIYIYDDVPPNGYKVYKMKLWLEGALAPVIIANDENLGTVSHDDAGNAFFTARNWKDFVFSKPAAIVYIQMCDQEGRLLYEAYQPGCDMGKGSAVGIFAYGSDGQLRFTCGDDAAAVAAYAEFALPEERGEEGTEPQETVEETMDGEEPVSDAEVTEPRTISEEDATTEATEAPAIEVENHSEEETIPTEVPMLADSIAVVSTDNYAYYDYSLGENMMAQYTYEPMPELTVQILLGPGALRHGYEWRLLEIIYSLMDYLIPALAAGLLLFSVTVVYLCCAAGKKPGVAEIRAGGLNRIPLELYLLAAGAGVILCCGGIAEGGYFLLENDFQTGCFLVLLMAFAACLLVVGFCFAFAAQVKTPGLYLVRNSLCGRSVKLLGWLWRKFRTLCCRLLRAWDEKLGPAMVRLLKALWKLTKFFWLKLKSGCLWLLRMILRGCDWMGRQLTRFLSLLPLTWQFLLVGFTLVLLLYIMMRTYKVGYILVGFGIFFGVILYAASAFGILLENAKRMRKGDLDSKVDDKLLIGAFRDFAEELNGLADVAVVAAQKQLKSERMKTELITNVSHDIKTPLTSIINYVDLMEKPHTPEEQQAYLEVLSRQSLRLKKLVDDLMEMSKASTGNMAVEITRVNAVETVNQALGEFADKLDRAQLIPVFRQPDNDMYMMADGRLVWRVLSNVLSNAVKYALPGTRLYIDLMAVDGKVVLSLKNISRESLNVSADELLERFVRGDTARNTEGSGLGLNIAKSLMELQKGQLQLLVDGDLFKVTLIFPTA